MQRVFLLAQGEVLLLQQAAVRLQHLLQAEFVNRVGNDPAQGVSREIILHDIVLYPSVHGLHGELLASLPGQHDHRIGQGDGLPLGGGISFPQRRG